MRNYSRINQYLDSLQSDIYPQPQDSGHTQLARESITAMFTGTVGSVLDAGCGEGFCQPFFTNIGMEYSGVCLGDDYEIAKRTGRNVFSMDFSFLDFKDNSFDYIYSRHSLEHSPIPLLTLMEWHRVCRSGVFLVLPAPEHWRYGGRNHYFVLLQEQWRVLFDVAGFDVTYEYVKEKKMQVEKDAPIVPIEYWYKLEKR